MSAREIREAGEIQENPDSSPKQMHAGRRNFQLSHQAFGKK